MLSLVANLERTAPFDPDAPGAAASLLGQWDLVFARWAQPSCQLTQLAAHSAGSSAGRWQLAFLQKHLRFVQSHAGKTP